MAKAIPYKWKAFALTLCVGVVPFFVANTQAAERLVEANTLYSAFSESMTTRPASSPQSPQSNVSPQPNTSSSKTRWLDDYPKRIGLTLSADANIVANYIWRGQYVGGLSLQTSARINYEGLFADMWWNVGATDWAFSGFNPEVDIALGLDRWGLQLYWMHMHYFDSTPFFDCSNAAPGQAGNTSELRARYTISSRLPLSILWCTRLAGRDGYLDSAGNLQRAWSSYLELKYTFALPYDIGITAAVGMTPWRSFYTGFKGDFAVVNIDVALSKQWQVKQCSFLLAGEVMLNPWQMTKENVRWEVRNPWQQRINANLTLGVSWQYKHNHQSTNL